MDYRAILIYKDESASELACMLNAAWYENQGNSNIIDLYTPRTIDGINYYVSTEGVTNMPNGWHDGAVDYRLPDPDASLAQAQERYIVSDTGSRIRYKYYMNSGKPHVLMYNPQLLKDGQYYTISNDIVVDRDFTGAVEVYFGMYYVSRTNWRDAGKIMPTYGFYLRPNLGTTFGDIYKQGAFNVPLWDGSQISPGYKPTKKNNRQGGRGTGTIAGVTRAERIDTAARNLLFSYGSSNGDGLTYYIIGDSQLPELLKVLYKKGDYNDMSYVRSALISGNKVPAMDWGTTGQDVTIRVADIDTKITASVLSDRFKTKRLQRKSFSAVEATGTYADFTNLKMRLILPFVGSVNLDPTYFVGEGGWIEIEVTVDAYTGNIVYWVYGKSCDAEVDQDTLYGTYAGNCAVKVPLCGAGVDGSTLQDVKNISSTIATGASSVVGGMMSGNIPGVVAGLASSAIGLIGDTMKINHPTYSVDKAGTIDTNSTTLQPWQVAIEFEIPVVLYTEENTKEVGVPSWERHQIKDFIGQSGIYFFDAFNLDTISDASDQEKGRIRELLKSGVYI